MRTAIIRLAVLVAGVTGVGPAAADAGTLSEDLRISSGILGYELQYRVYTPAGVATGDRLPTLYVTDGQAYLEEGHFKAVLDEAIAGGDIEPVVAVFLDSRNPDDLAENRRNHEFMCNSRFAAFFANELVPYIDQTYPVSPSREHRVVMGLSFGGLNSACFGLMIPNVFSGIVMQSPASEAHVDIVRRQYESREALPLKMFLSVGTRNDNYDAVKKFRRTLEVKGYDVTFITVRRGHDWDNWGPLLDDVLITFF